MKTTLLDGPEFSWFDQLKHTTQLMKEFNYRENLGSYLLNFATTMGPYMYSMFSFGVLVMIVTNMQGNMS